MKFAIIGGTHGNELVGIEVMHLLKQETPPDSLYEYHTFLGNPKAYEDKVRFVDSDLNRCFGSHGVSEGYEKKRSLELKEQIIGNYDFLIDLHTTTTNMGLTIVLTRNDETSLRAACYLQDQIPEIKLIATSNVNEDCAYTTAMTKSALLIEVGAVPHNVISADYVQNVHKMMSLLLSWDFKTTIDLKERIYYQSCGVINFPADESFYVHPQIEHTRFKKLNPGDPIFVNIKGNLIPYEGTKSVYPFFINEAAYQDLRIAMSLATLEINLENYLNVHL